MKKLLSILTIAVLVLSVMPAIAAVSIGSGLTPDIGTEDFEPLVWQCDSRIVLDDATEPGRQSADGEVLFERLNNYAFEGEQIQWNVLVMDKNGINKIEDVFATIGSVQGAGNDIEVNCVEDLTVVAVDPSCNARIGEEEITAWDSALMRSYTCTLTVETPDSMYGEYWITVEATDLDGLAGIMAENEYWFLNPVIALSIDGDLTFTDVRPGTMSYSDTLIIENDADAGSGVTLDMFISGTDFYDSMSSGAMCPITNQLLLGDGESDCDVGSEFGGPDASTDPFCYFASNGAYSTQTDARNDVEGYVGINYGIGFNNPTPFYGTANGDVTGFEIIQGPVSTVFPSPTILGPYFAGNTLTPGAEVAVTFRLALPEPCNGDFDTGSIYFWGEAI